MLLRLDKSIMGRVLFNFILLFGLLFVFAATIDIILNLDEFMALATRAQGDDVGWLRHLISAVGFALGYHLPQLFQFYAWLYGLVLIGAACFTMAQMSRHRELLALAASGISLYRIAAPFIGVAILLGAVQLINQEMVLPKLAPLLLRAHGDADQDAVDAFPVKFTSDANGTLMQAASFDPGLSSLRHPSFLERDASGRTTRRWWADTAIWDPQAQGWILTNGHIVEIAADGRGSTRARPIDLIQTDLSPTRLTMRRYGQIAGMLSLRQIMHMLEWPDAKEATSLRRSAASRFAVVVLNVLLLIIALPFLLDREPGSLFARSVLCAAVVIPVYFISAGAMLVPLPGIGPVVGVVIPALVLLPVALIRLGSIRT